MNPYADDKLVKRFKASGHKNIRDMVKGHDVDPPKQDGKETCMGGSTLCPLTMSRMFKGHNVDPPKQGGKETCMSWACKGACNAACKRVGMHNRYTQETITAYHGLMDTCGVAANPQE